VCPYFSAVPDHGHVFRSRVMDLCLFSDISDITDLFQTFAFQDSGVVGPALLAPGRVVTDTQSLHGLEAQSSNGAPLRHHTCSQLCHPALLTQD
jgi:hypothetical protein